MKNLKHCLFSVFLLLLMFSLPVNAAQSGNTTQAPYFYVEGTDPATDSFPLKATNVVTNIRGVIAETYVTQTYANEGENPINATYVFPASTKVAVHGMKMQIGDKIITARIREREDARQEYETAKSEGKSASLLEQQRPNVFTMDIANVMPGDVVSIELHYTELISPVDGTYEFVFPTVAGPRYASPHIPASPEKDAWVSSPFRKAGETPSEKYNIAVNLSTGVPITGITCKSHNINVVKERDADARITLSNPETFAGDRDFILDYKLTGQEVTGGLMLSAGETENFFMLLVQPPERYIEENIPPREYIFVLDISGSMYGFPLDTAKDLIRNLVSNLRETDRFNLILFADSVAQMSPDSVPANAQNVARAIALIDRLNGGGGTELSPALESAVHIPADEEVSRSIVTITDGYLSGEQEIFDLIQANSAHTSFFSFGIGSSVNRYLIDGIAKAGSGESFIVTDPEDAKDTAERFRTYIQSPVLTDIHVEYDGFDVYDVQPSSVPTLFAEKPVVLFGKWRGDPTGVIQISGKTGKQDYVQNISVSEVQPLADNNTISYLWARTKVDSLTCYGCSQGDSFKKEITALGLTYSMMTPYTSFIAVTDTVRNSSGSSTDVKQPVPLPLNVSELAVGGGYTVGSEPDSFLFLIAAALLFAGNRLYLKKKKKAAAGG